MARVAVVAAVLAAAPVEAYRPLVTEDTGTVDRGRVELQLNSDVERGDETLWATRAVTGFGITDRFEARVETGVGAVDAPGERGRAGLVDSVIGLEHRLFDESAARPAVLAAATGRLPTARSGLGDDGARDTRDAVVVRAGAIARVSPRLAVDAAVGFGVTRGSPDVEATVGLTVVW